MPSFGYKTLYFLITQPSTHTQIFRMLVYAHATTIRPIQEKEFYVKIYEIIKKIDSNHEINYLNLVLDNFIKL